MSRRKHTPPSAIRTMAWNRSSILRLAVEASLVFVAYGALTIWATWPLFAQPGSTVLDADHAWLAGWFTPGFIPAIRRDIDLLVWLFAWDWHALTSSPASLFGANIFHPAPEALAYSEHGLGHLPVSGLTQWLTGNPVLAHQVNLLLTFPLSGVAMYLLLRHWHARAFAAFLAGLVYALCPVRLDMIYHSHLLAGQYFVLALLFLDRTLARGRIADTAALSLVLGLGFLSSYYVAYMMSIGMLIGGVFMLRPLRDRPTRRGIVAAGLAAGSAGALFVLVSQPYLRLKLAGSIEDYSAVAPTLSTLSNDLWRNYVFPPALLKNGTLKLDQGGHAYLGLVPLLLVMLSLVPIRGVHAQTRRRARRVGIAVAVASYVLALGPITTIGGYSVLLPYGWAMELIPGFSSTRVPSRFDLLLVAGWAILVGLGTDYVGRLLERQRIPRVATFGILGIVLAIVVFEYDLPGAGYAARPELTSADDLRVYRTLATLPPGPVLELPFDGEGEDGAGQYMVRSTIHWQPLLNGSSGYVPSSLPIVRTLARLLPDADAQRLLIRMTGVRYVIVHTASMTPATVQQWLVADDAKVIGTIDSDLLFRLTRRPADDLRTQLVACSRQREACDALRQMVSELEQSIRKLQLRALKVFGG